MSAKVTDVNDAMKTDKAAAEHVLFESDGVPMPSPEQVARDKESRTFMDEAKHIGEILERALPTMRARANKSAKPVPLPWPRLAESLGGGLWPGLHVLTGATGHGKTQFALQAAFSAAKSGTPVLYVGLELGELDISSRLLTLAAAEAKYNKGVVTRWSDLYSGRGGNLDAIEKAGAPILAAMSLFIEFGPPMGWSFTQLHNRVGALRELHQEATPGSRPLLVVLDYLQAVGAPEKARLDLRERISRAAYEGRAAARDFGAAVLMLSSVSRTNAKELNGKDTTSTESEDRPASDFVGMGKESGDIEYAADTVLALVPKGEWDGSKRTMRLAIAKMRAGVPSSCELSFDGSTFSESGAVATAEERKGAWEK